MTVTLTHLGTPTNYTTIQAAVNAGVSGDLIEIDDDVVYYETVTLASKTGLTLRPLPGASPVIRAVIEGLVTAPLGQWAYYGPVNGYAVYYVPYTYTTNNVSVVRHATGKRLWTYGSWDNFVNGANRQHAGEGIYVDYTANRCYVTLTGNANPNNVALRISFSNWVMNLNATDSCVIEDLTIESGGESVIQIQNSDSNTIQRCNIRFAELIIWYKDPGAAQSSSNIIQDCYIEDNYNAGWSWEDVKSITPKNMESSAIYQAGPGTGNIFRRNQISGVFNGIVMARQTTGAPYLDGTLIYENTIHDIRDDALEFEANLRNIQAYDNYIYDTYIAISYSPVEDGPCYIYRNRFITDKTGAAGSNGRGTKRSIGDNCNQIFVYHNTFYSHGDVVQHNNGAPAMTNVRFINNIFYSEGGTNFNTVEGSPIYTDTGNDMDGNCHYKLDNTGNLLTDYATNGVNYASLATFRASAPGIASGWEVNGMQADPLINISTYPYPLLLTSVASPCVGAGIALDVSWPDATAYDGDLTIGYAPFEAPAAPPTVGEKRVGFVQAAVNTAIGNQTFRDPDLIYTPTAALLIMSNATIAGTPANNLIMSVGAVTSTTERWCIAEYEEHGIATAICRRRTVEDGCALLIDGANTVVAKADFVQWEADAGAGAGITINWSNAPEGAYLMTIFLFNADDAQAGTVLTHPTLDNTRTVSTGFESSAILCANAGLAIPASNSDRNFSFGFGVRDLEQRAFAVRAGHGSGATNDSGRFFANRMCGEVDNLGAVLWSFELTAVNPTDFVLTQRDVGEGIVEVGYLALDLGTANCWVGEFNTPVSNGLSAKIGVGFEPETIMLGLTNMENANVAYVNNLAGAYGIAGTNSPTFFHTHFWSSEDAADPTNAESLVIENNFAITDDDGVAQIAGVLSSFDADGFTLNFTSTILTAKKMFALAIEAEVTVSSPMYAYMQQ